MYFDRFDICEAYQVFTMTFGSFSIELAQFEWKVASQLNRLKYSPSILSRFEPKELSENGKAIYMALVEKYFGIKSTAPNTRGILSCCVGTF